MAGYVKLFGSILQSTVWLGPLPTKIVWITMLALADRDGVVEGSIPGLAHTAGVARDECEEALNKFLSPDPDSRTSANEGRRIVKVPGGWRLLNFEAYRERLDADDQREKAAERKRRQRDRQATAQGTLDVNVAAQVGDVTSERDGHAVSREVTPVTPCHAKSRQEEAEAEASPDQIQRERERARQLTAEPARKGKYNAVQIQAAISALEAINRIRKVALPRSHGIRPTQDTIARICALFVLGYREEDFEIVARRYASESQRDHEKARWFNAETMFVAANFARTLSMADADEIPRSGSNGRSALQPFVPAFAGPARAARS